MIGVENSDRWLTNLPQSREKPSVKMDIQLDRKPNRELSYLSKWLDAPKKSLVQGFAWTLTAVFRVAPRSKTPKEQATDLYCPGIDLAEFRRFDPDKAGDAKSETLQAMVLATVMG